MRTSLRTQRMVMRQMSLYLLLGHLLIAGVGSVCVNVLCLKCNTTGQTPPECPVCPDSQNCINVSASNLTNCKKEFKVHVNSSISEPNEGNDITLNCIHDLPNLNLTFEWMKNGEILKGKNTSTLFLKKVLQRHNGQYHCSVNSTCGHYESSPHVVDVKNNNLVLLVICGVGALVVVVIIGVVMKYKLKRDSARYKERMKQRGQDGQTATQPPYAPRES
ncbi:uncharacterized protein LOC104927065 [Larimichthys crocea]|nr:uncharacterized protein LOC104927065 [Larimichthys crocea]